METAVRLASAESDGDCEYLPPAATGSSFGRRGAGAGAAPTPAPCTFVVAGPGADSDADYDDGSDYSDDSACAAGAKRKRSKAALSGRRPGGAGGTRVLHRWTAEEHARLEALVRQYGTERNWALIAEGIRGRSGKQCRERWLNHMREGIIKGNWLADEEFHLALCHALVGNQWSQHCNRLRGRTENSIKNYWNATLRSKQASKRRGFLWTYIDRVRGALDDEGLRHRAFAETVRSIHSQNEDWLPVWLRARISSGELEVPRAGEGLPGRCWRRLMDRELAFLRDKEADAASTGIPFPNPASRGVGIGMASAADGGDGDGSASGEAGGAAPVERPLPSLRRPQPQCKQQRPSSSPLTPPDAVRMHRQQAQALPCSPPLEPYQPATTTAAAAAAAAAAGDSMAGGLELMCSADLSDAMALVDAGVPGTHCPAAAAGARAACDAGAEGAAGAGAGAYGGAAGDDADLLLPELPDSFMPDTGAAGAITVGASAGGMAAVGPAAPPGLPRLVVTGPGSQAWWGSVSSNVFAAAAAATNAAAVACSSGPEGSTAAASPPISRESSFCASVGSAGGAAPIIARLRLSSASPAPQSPLAPQPAQQVPGAHGGAARAYHQPPGLAHSASYGSDYSAASGFQASQLGQQLYSLQQQQHHHHHHQQQQHSSQQQQHHQPQPQHDHQQQGGSQCGTPTLRAPCSTPFGSPHAQSGGLFEGGWAAGPATVPASPPRLASPANGVAVPGAPPGLSRFATARNSSACTVAGFGRPSHADSVQTSTLGSYMPGPPQLVIPNPYYQQQASTPQHQPAQGLVVMMSPQLGHALPHGSYPSSQQEHQQQAQHQLHEQPQQAEPVHHPHQQHYQQQQQHHHHHHHHHHDQQQQQQQQEEEEEGVEDEQLVHHPQQQHVEHQHQQQQPQPQQQPSELPQQPLQVVLPVQLPPPSSSPIVAPRVVLMRHSTAGADTHVHGSGLEASCDDAEAFVPSTARVSCCSAGSMVPAAGATAGAASAGGRLSDGGGALGGARLPSMLPLLSPGTTGGRPTGLPMVSAASAELTAAISSLVRGDSLHGDVLAADAIDQVLMAGLRSP